jgi:hypothetical protein
MSKLGQFLFLLILTTNLSAFEITAMEKGEMVNSGDGSFPVLKETSKAAKRINSHMQLEILNLKVGHHKKSIYEAFPWGTSIEGHEIWENSPQILSILIHQMSCGGSCSYYDYYYNFDAKRGKLFSIDDIFTATGWQSTTKKLLAQWDKAVAKFLKIHEPPSAENPSEESDEQGGEGSLEERFMDCRSGLFFERFYITGGALHFPGIACLGKRDELEFDGVIPINQLTTQLTEFGQQILQPANAIPNLSSKLLHGTIAGKYPITLMITSFYKMEENDIYHLEGYYWYDKHGIGIRLVGDLKNKQLILEEFDKSGEVVVATIKGTMTQAGIKGTWKSMKRRKKLSFEVSP